MTILHECIYCHLLINGELWELDEATRDAVTHPSCPQPAARIQKLMDEGRLDDAQQLGALWDAAIRRTQPAPPLVDAALWYASQGLRLFPLQPGGKQPYPGSHGFKDATSNPDTITGWWGKAPESNIGIATGHLVDVIDIDGPDGARGLAECEDLPPILGQVATPRRHGQHLYVPATGKGNRAGINEVDYRGLGGYVVAPPSILAPSPDRDYHGEYRWTENLNLRKDN